MGKDMQCSYRVDAVFYAEMHAFANKHFGGNLSRLTIAAVERFMQEESEKTAKCPEKVIEAIQFILHIMSNSPNNDRTWKLLLEEVKRVWAMLDNN